VSVYSIRRRRGRRRAFEVRWKAAGRGRSKSFVTRGLADSYHAELVRAARLGLEFDPVTGEPALWAVPARSPVTWHAHAVAYAAMKWPALSAHSRASVADALTTITPALTRSAPGRPPAAVLRAALYACAFNPVCATPADPAAEAALAYAERASVPVARLADPAVLRAALDALAVRLDGRRAAANTITRKRAVPHNAVGYAVETGLLDANQADQGSWRPPKASGAVNPQVMASPAQAEALLAAAEQGWPQLTAFFGCLYYAALRPEEAIALRHADCRLPAPGWGRLTLTRTAPRTAAAWTGNGTSHEQRGLKQRPEHAVRAVPIPPALVTLLRRHHDRHGTADNGRLFPGSRGGLLSESTYGRAWQQARTQRRRDTRTDLTTVSYRFRLGEAFLAAGDPKRAIPLLQQVLSNAERTLGNSHPTTEFLRSSLADLCMAAGDLEPAIQLLQQLLSNAERTQVQTTRGPRSPGIPSPAPTSKPVTCAARSRYSSKRSQIVDGCSAVTIPKP
jgi:integrase